MSDDFLLLKRVEDLEQKVEYLLEELRLADKYQAPPLPADADVLALAQEGKLIPAIQLYRQKHHADLREAKDAVEAMLAPARK